MWIWIANKFVKFHAKIPNRNEIIPKSFRGLLFSETPCMYVCCHYVVNRDEYIYVCIYIYIYIILPLRRAYLRWTFVWWIHSAQQQLQQWLQQPFCAWNHCSNGYLLRCTRRVWCTECTVQSPQCSSLFIPLLSVCPMLCMDRISIGICVCVCLSVCPSHFLPTRLQVRPLNGFLQLIA